MHKKQKRGQNEFYDASPVHVEKYSLEIRKIIAMQVFTPSMLYLSRLADYLDDPKLNSTLHQGPASDAQHHVSLSQ